MFIVVEHLLTNLDHLVAHILDLRHPLHRNTQKKRIRSELMGALVHHMLHLM